MYVEFDVNSCEKSFLHITDIELKNTAKFHRDSFETNRKYHFLFTIFYISFTSYF